MSKNLEAVTEAMTWLDTPYHHQGRVKGVRVAARDVWKPTSWNYSTRITQATADS